MSTKIKLDGFHCMASYKAILLSTEYPGILEEDNLWIKHIMKKLS